jgi:hypothetical protein
MAVISFLALRPYDVWVIPTEETSQRTMRPQHISQRLAEYAEALALAHATCDALAAQGATGGRVLVMWTASAPRILRTLYVPAGSTT